MKTQLTWKECLDQVAKKYDCQSYKYWTEKLGHNIPEFATEEAADLYRNQPSSLNKEELRKEYILASEKAMETGSFAFVDWWIEKLSAKQREVDELKDQMAEKVKEAIALMPLYGEKQIHTEMRIMREQQAANCKCEVCERINAARIERESEILSKLGLEETKTKI